MNPTIHEGRTRALTVGQLCVGGDWACANGDLGGLRDVAGLLAALSDEPLHCELAQLGDACRSDPDRAVASCFEIRDRLLA